MMAKRAIRIPIVKPIVLSSDCQGMGPIEFLSTRRDKFISLNLKLSSKVWLIERTVRKNP